MFETFSFLPPLTDAEISRQVDYIVRNGWSECRCRPPPAPAAQLCLLLAYLLAESVAGSCWWLCDQLFCTLICKA